MSAFYKHLGVDHRSGQLNGFAKIFFAGYIVWYLLWRYWEFLLSKQVTLSEIEESIEVVVQLTF